MTTKAQLIADLAGKTSLTKKQIEGVLDAVAEVAAASVKADGAFTLPNMMIIKLRDVKAKAARSGTNPLTGKPFNSPAKPPSKKVVLKPVKAFTAACCG